MKFLKLGVMSFDGANVLLSTLSEVLTLVLMLGDEEAAVLLSELEGTSVVVDEGDDSLEL